MPWFKLVRGFLSQVYEYNNYWTDLVLLLREALIYRSRDVLKLFYFQLKPLDVRSAASS